MCGIAGLLATRPADPAVLDRMQHSLRHRGPDDGGIWTDMDGRLALVHRRLAVVDLSPMGHQPMLSADGRWALCYNGEIYNHAAIRAELGEGIAWRGHSDSETLVEAIARWGLERTLKAGVGMFALALWDRRERRLFLARDRFGEKPLYYGWVGADFAFASELKALRVLPRFDNPVSRLALGQYLARGYVPAPLTIHERLFKLQPGTILEVDAQRAHEARAVALAVGHSEGGLSLSSYWSYREVVEDGLADPFGSESEALDALDSIMGEAISGQAVADVPVGAFLSGGIDSSTVVALYRKHTSGSIRTFSIGFAEAGFDEAPYARAVARHFGTEHHEHYVTAQQTQGIVPQLPTMYDEPFADSSQIPTHIVSAFAREHVTVALSGDGGDELFGGYNRHIAVPRLWSRLRRLPASARAAIGGSLGSVPPRVWDGTIGRLPRIGRPMLGTKVQRAMQVAARSSDFGALYCAFLDDWGAGVSPVLGGDGGAPFPSRLEAGSDTVWAMYCDATTYLPDDVLCKVDRASMAVSLETRAPFLDHRVAAVAARIPIEMKIVGGTGKQVLRKLLFREVPAMLFDRPKAGFAIPVGTWIRGPLRPWAETLLDERRMRDEGFLDAAPIRERWQRHLAGESDGSQALWSVLMFQAWLDAERSAVGGPPERRLEKVAI